MNIEEKSSLKINSILFTYPITMTRYVKLNIYLKTVFCFHFSQDVHTNLVADVIQKHRQNTRQAGGRATKQTYARN